MTTMNKILISLGRGNDLFQYENLSISSLEKEIEKLRILINQNNGINGV